MRAAGADGGGGGGGWEGARGAAATPGGGALRVPVAPRGRVGGDGATPRPEGADCPGPILALPPGSARGSPLTGRPSHPPAGGQQGAGPGQGGSPSRGWGWQWVTVLVLPEAPRPGSARHTEGAGGEPRPHAGPSTPPPLPESLRSCDRTQQPLLRAGLSRRCGVPPSPAPRPPPVPAPGWGEAGGLGAAASGELGSRVGRGAQRCGLPEEGGSRARALPLGLPAPEASAGGSHQPPEPAVWRARPGWGRGWPQPGGHPSRAAPGTRGQDDPRISQTGPRGGRGPLPRWGCQLGRLPGGGRAWRVKKQEGDRPELRRLAVCRAGRRGTGRRRPKNKVRPPRAHPWPAPAGAWPERPRRQAAGPRAGAPCACRQHDPVS